MTYAKWRYHESGVSRSHDNDKAQVISLALIGTELRQGEIRISYPEPASTSASECVIKAATWLVCCVELCLKSSSTSNTLQTLRSRLRHTGSFLGKNAGLLSSLGLNVPSGGMAGNFRV